MRLAGASNSGLTATVARSGRPSSARWRNTTQSAWRSAGSGNIFVWYISFERCHGNSEGFLVGGLLASFTQPRPYVKSKGSGTCGGLRSGSR